MPRRRPPRIATPVVVLAAAMIGVGVFAAVTSQDRSPEPAPEKVAPLERVRSQPGEEGGPPIAIGPGPDAYTVTYEVREPGRAAARESIAVRRPYASRRTTARDVTDTGFSRLRVAPKTAAATVVSPPPGPVDPRPALVVGRAEEEGFLDRREVRSVIGRRCQVFRTLAPVSSSTISAALPGRYTDICLDADGLVLEEWQVEDGRATRQRVARRVERRAEVGTIDEEPTLSATQGGGSVLATDAASRPEGRFYVLDAAPAGFTLRGRYSVVPPQAGLDDPEGRRKAVASTADVYERGADVLVVDRGSTLNLDPAFQPRPEGRRVPDIGPAFGGAPGELLLTWNGPEVRWGDEDGRFVRVYGTVDVDLVVETIRALRVVEDGTGLVFTGGPL